MATRPNYTTFNWLDWVSWIIVIIGALNLGLAGVLEFDLISAILGGTDSVGARMVFVIVGLAGIWAIYTFWKAYEIHIERMQVQESEGEEEKEEKRRAA
ncbi:MAG: DUF378 domain-containing protein [Actinobacteria bacterium]|nr:MAG: DUF378 domain-containing protein [Actinomycetota bacterium]